MNAALFLIKKAMASAVRKPLLTYNPRFLQSLENRMGEALERGDRKTAARLSKLYLLQTLRQKYGFTQDRRWGWGRSDMLSDAVGVNVRSRATRPMGEFQVPKATGSISYMFQEPRPYLGRGPLIHPVYLNFLSSFGNAEGKLIRMYSDMAALADRISKNHGLSLVPHAFPGRNMTHPVTEKPFDALPMWAKLSVPHGGFTHYTGRNLSGTRNSWMPVPLTDEIRQNMIRTPLNWKGVELYRLPEHLR